MSRLLINFRDVIITGVEKGSADKDVERPVCAFTFNDDNGNKVKALLKGPLAKLAYQNYLVDKQTECASVEFEDGTYLEKNVSVSFDAVLREERESEVVVDQIDDIEFTFKYRMME